MSGFKDSAGQMALDAGLRHLDTAQAYGEGKQEVRTLISLTWLLFKHGPADIR